ncbi:hypothetical protein L5515_002461 [Caenorhabditis briggsae]|uniref:PAN-3 domain-containing protein n=1 Tax=Caenorhabditis briggsae TaxID=6238 RepID=A0AAE9E5I3_CAEBR|nr:hypothetical protein L5515_002461 [Caenorhabditis briggsae]
MSTCLAAYYQVEFPEICEIFEIGKLAKIQKLNAYSGKIMAVKVVPTGEITRLEAQKLCAEDFQGVLSGFDSDFEHTSAIKSAVLLVPKNTPYKYYGYYMDGERKTNCRYLNQTGPDCNGNKGFLFFDTHVTTYDHYLWGFDNQPNGMADNLGTSNSVAMRVHKTYGAGLDDLPCNGSTSTIFMNGFICGFPPNYEI